jgi:cohesin loading factor subunit SCC2
LPALVALETSPIQAISDTAYEEHKSLWKKNTGMEKEYMNGVSFAFEHQRDIIHDSKGATGGPHSTAKLNRCYDVLCNGELKQRKKFLSNLVERHKFPLSKADTSGDSPRPLHYARFCLENLAFFDYARTDEVMHVVSCMEKFFAKAAVAVANDIEIHVLGTGRLEDTTKQEEGANAALHPSLGLVNGTSAQNDIPLVDTMQHAHGETSILPPADPPTRQVDKALLRHLTVSSMILSVIEHSRRFLMLHYSLKALLEIKTNGKATKGENNKPVVAKNSNGDKYLRQVAHIMTSLDSTDTMLAQCSAFIDLVHNDDDFKIDDDAQLLKAALEGYDTPTNDDTASVPGSGRGRKRKSSLPAGTPRKRKAVGTGRTKGRSQKNRSGSSGTPDGDGYSD